MTPHHMSSSLHRSMRFSGSVLRQQQQAGVSKSWSSETSSSAYLKVRVKHGIGIGGAEHMPGTSYLSSPKLQTIERNSFESKQHGFRNMMTNPS